ncbi:MAG: hypothetical protein RSB96_02285 [Oscillospiraceae bacterium]
MIAMIAASPYQILNALSLSMHSFKDEPIDLYVYSSFYKGVADTSNKLKNSNLFANVYLPVDPCVFMEVPEKTNLFNEYELEEIEKVVQNGFGVNLKEKFYDKIVCASINRAGTSMVSYFSYYNKLLETYLYDEGLAQYLSYADNMDNSIAFFEQENNYMVKVIKNHSSIPKLTAHFLNQPDLYVQERFAPVQKLPKFDTKNTEMVAMLSELHHYDEKEDEFINRKIVFFSQPIATTALTRIQLFEVLSIIETTFCIDDFIVKLHPGESNNFPELRHYHISEKSGTPWEIFCMNHDYSDKIFITSFSSAVFTPNMLFDQQPTIIILDNLKYEVGNRDTALNAFFTRFRAAYPDPNKVFIPKTMGEFSSILASLKHKEELNKQ